MGLGLVFILIIITLIVTAFLKPKFSFLLSVVFIFNGFGLLNWFFREYGFAKSIDYAYLFAFVSVISIKNKTKKQFFKDSDLLIKLFYLFILFLIFEMIKTIFTYNQNFIHTIQVARYYIGFLFFYPTIIFLKQDDVNVEKYFLFMFWVGLIGTILYILVSLFDISFLSFMFKKDYFDIGYDYLSSYNVKRVYGGLSYPVYLIAGSILAYLVERKIQKKKYLFWIIIGLFLFSVFLSYGRGYISGLVITLFIVFLFSNAVLYKKIISLIIFSLSSLIVSSFISYYLYDDIFYLTDTFVSRMYEGSENINKNTGTFSVRMNVVEERWEIVKENPFFGAGLYHPKTGSFFQDLEAGSITTAHNGYIQTLVLFGFIGLLLLVTITALLFYNAYKVTKLNAPFYYRALALASMGNFIAYYFNMLSTLGFLTSIAISTMGIQAGIFYYCLRKYKKQEKKFIIDKDKYNNCYL